MGTRESRHNKGRKPTYKDHRLVAAHLIAHPAYPSFGAYGSSRGNGWYNTRSWWTEKEMFKLDILCEADADVEQAADALGRSPTSISHRARDFGLVLPSQWSRLIAPKYIRKLRVQKDPILAYPYITKVRDEHADLLAINAMIPKSIPDNMRADMCQEIMLAILEGRTTLEMLKAKSNSGVYFIKKFYHDNYEAGGHAISFNDTDDDYDEDAIASSIAAKEWHREQFAERTAYADTMRTFTPPTQFEAAYRDQVGRIILKRQELGEFLSEDDVEEMLSADNSL